MNISGKYWNIGSNYRYTRAWMSHPKQGLVGIPAEGWQYADDDDKTSTWFDDEQLTVREIEVKECTQVFTGILPGRNREREEEERKNEREKEQPLLDFLDKL